jgi:hypothetical protein
MNAQLEATDWHLPSSLTSIASLLSNSAYSFALLILSLSLHIIILSHFSSYFRKPQYFKMKYTTSLLVAAVTLLLTCETTSAFVKGHVARGAGSSASQSRTRPYMVGELNMAAAKKAAAKKAPAAKKAAAKAEKAPVDNFKKADFVASVAEKTGMTKTQSEEALNAVLDTITDVSGMLCVCCVVCFGLKLKLRCRIESIE